MSFEFSLEAGLALLSYYNKVDGQFVKFLQSIPKNANERFYDTYDLSTFRSISDEDMNRLLFSITKILSRNIDGNSIDEYYSFEEDEIIGSVGRDNGEIRYGSAEIEFFRSRYAPARPENQVSLTPPAGNFNSSQAVVENDGMQYDSLSSFENFTQEDFVVTATAGTTTELITTATEQISDVGGTISRNREITNTSATGQVAQRASDAGISTTTVTTSGY